MRLYIVRHGQTPWNLEGRAQGHTDIGTDEVGAIQSRLVIESLSKQMIKHVYSSDLLRCRQIAEPLSIALSAPLDLDSDLRERSFGAWEGELYEHLRSNITQIAEETSQPEFYVTPPGGESAFDLWKRISRVVEALSNLNEPSAVVTHGGAKSMLVAQLIGHPPEVAKTFRFGNTAVTELSRESGNWEIVRFGDVSHLEEPSAEMRDTYAPIPS